MMTRAVIATLLVPVVLALVIAGCNGGGGGGGDAVSTVPTPPVAPSGLTYTVPTAVYNIAEAITPNEATVSGDVDTFEISPFLPAGLSFDVLTGTIVGAPLVVSGPEDYTVTATGPGGQTSVTINITVIPLPVNDLEYDTPVVYALGVQITANAPGNPAAPGDVLDYTVSPDLPDGLQINANSGLIFGTPLVELDPTDFTVSELTTSGTNISIVDISIITTEPGDLAYLSPVTYFKDIEITANLPTQTGSPATEFEVSPPLPDGLELDESSGAITGTPTELSDPTDHTVTGTNSGGSTSAIVTIEVVEPTDCALQYETPVTYVPGVAAPDNVPTFDAACVLDSFTVSPDLPSGLTLDEDTGTISGTPDERTDRTSYTVKGTGIGGDSGVATVVITVGPIFKFILQDIEVHYPTDTGEASFSVKVSIEEGPDNEDFPNSMTAFQMGFKFDTTLIDAIEINQGTDLEDLNGGNGPDFFFPLIRLEGITIGVVISTLGSDQLIADEIREVLDVDFSTVADEFIDNDIGAIVDLFFDDTMGPVNEDGEVIVPIRNIVTLDDDGLEVEEDTVRVDGSVDLIPDEP